jgi:hypothetical protein
MITYQNAIRYPAAFNTVFGCSIEDFDRLYAEFAVVYEQRVAQSALTRKTATPRMRKAGAGRRFKHPLRERLLLALLWLRVHPTLKLLGYFFSMDKTSAEDNLKDVLATMQLLGSFVLEYPNEHSRKRHTQEQVIADFPELTLLLDDGQQLDARSGNPEKQT